MIIYISNTSEMINTDHIVYIRPEFRMIPIPGSNDIQALGDIIVIALSDGSEQTIKFDTENRRDRAIDIIYAGFGDRKTIVNISNEPSK